MYEDGKVRMVLKCSVSMFLEEVYPYMSDYIGKSSGRRWFFGRIGNKANYFIKCDANVPPKEGWNVG